MEFDTFNKEDDMKKTFTYVGLSYSVLLIVNIVLFILLRCFFPDIREAITGNNVSKILVGVLPVNNAHFTILLFPISFITSYFVFAFFPFSS